MTFALPGSLGIDFKEDFDFLIRAPYVVKKVYEGGVACTLGIESGDELVAIGSEAVADFEWSQLVAKLAQRPVQASFYRHPKDRCDSTDSIVDPDSTSLDVGSMKSIIASRSFTRSKSTKLDHVSGLANQRIIGSYSVFEDYVKDKIVGTGMSGDVWKARLVAKPRWTETQKDVVMKSLKKDVGDERMRFLLTECEVGL